MIWTNLDFEYELRHGASWQPPKPVAQMLWRWRTLLRCMPRREHDVPWDTLEPASDLLCWGDSRRALLATRHPHPDRRLAAVLTANDKRTPYLISQLPALPHACIVDTMERLREKVRTCPHDWVLKHPLGVSGRERVMGRQGIMEPRHERWAERQIASGDALIFEPKVDIAREYSWHFTILPNGELEVLGRCELLTDTQGTHRGHIVTREARRCEPPEALLDEVRRLHAHTDYTGPVSSDGYEGELGGARIVREVSEFNARLTFGRVALELTRGCEGVEVAWWHPSRGESRDVGGLEPLDGSHEGWHRLPDAVDEAGASGTALYVGERDEQLSASGIERRWLAL